MLAAILNPIIFRGRTAMAALIASIALLSLSACSSYTDEIKTVQQEFRQADFAKALTELEKIGLQESDRNRLLYLLEKASILDRLGEAKKAQNLWLAADKLVDELFTLSLSKEAATYVYNESAQSYSGEDYEKVAIHTMLALSFLGEDKLDEARVEARRINTRLNEINNGYDKKKNRYGEDAFARYLAAMIYESRSEWDAAIVDYRQALETYEGPYTKLFATPVPADLVNRLYHLLEKRDRSDLARRVRSQYPRYIRSSPDRQNLGELVVIHELGTVAAKKRFEYLIPWGKEVLRLSFPMIQARPTYRFGRTGMSAGGKPFVAGQLVQNFDQIASETLEDRRLRLVLKQTARLVLKSQMTQEAEKQFGPIGGLIGNIFGAVTETADTRSWTLLPSAIYVTRYALEPGKHTINIYSNGRLSKIKEVEIKAGETVFLRDFG